MEAVADWSRLCSVKAHQLQDITLMKPTSALSCWVVTQQFRFKCTRINVTAITDRGFEHDNFAIE